MKQYAQLLQSLTTDAHTRVIVPYATPQDNTIVYRAWYGAYEINYNTKDQTITLYDDDDESTHKPIAFLYDRYRYRLVAAFELPDNNDTPHERPFLRVEIIHHYNTPHFDAQGPVFVFTEQHEPEL